MADLWHTGPGWPMVRCTAGDPPRPPTPGWTTVWVPGGCWACMDGAPFASWATGAWAALAATLAEPLRKAFRDHVDAHGCYLDTCAKSLRLWDLLPEGDRVLLGTAQFGGGSA